MSSIFKLSRKLLCCSILVGLFFSSSIYANGANCSLYLNESVDAVDPLARFQAFGPKAANDNLEGLREVLTSGNTREGSHYNYALLAERWKRPEILPRFVSPVAEAKLAEQWDGIEGGKVLQAFLPKGVTYIGHQLREPANPNVIKVQENGATVMLRVDADEFGLDTNVAISKFVPLYYIDKKVAPEDRYLVRKEAAAAIIYIHGGGTPTTGAHIAESEINHYAMYGIDVVSFDTAAHGEGSREFYADGQDEIDRIYKFIKRAVPEGVPVFVVGHSMGGVYADIMMRQSDKPDWPMKDIIQGFGILSPAVDAKPGASAHERALEMSRRLESQNTDPDFDKKAAPSEREIFDQMAKDGKLNPIASMHIGKVMAEMDHIPPAHNGDNWTPSIMVVGEGDPLVYIGFEDLFATAFNLTNVEKHSIAEAPDRNGDVKRVGHLLADYYIKSTVTDNSGKETEVVEVLPLKLVRDFINKRLVEIGKPALKSERNKNARDAASVFQAYASDLVFREWVENHRMVVKENLDGFKEIAREIPQLEAIIRNGFEGKFESKKTRKEKLELSKLSEFEVLDKLSDEYNVPTDELKPVDAMAALWTLEGLEPDVAAKLATVAIERRNLEAKREGTWVPEDLKSNGKVDLLMEDLKTSHEEIKVLRGEKADYLRELSAFRQRKITIEAQIKQVVKDMDKGDLAEVLPERAQGLIERFANLKPRFQSATENLEQEAGESITLYGELSADEERRLFEKYADDLETVTAVIKEYKDYRAETEVMFTEEVLRGRLGQEKLDLFVEYYGRHYLTVGEVAPNSLLGRWNAIHLKIAQVEGQIYRRYISIGLLEQQYWGYINPGLVKVEIVPIKTLLETAIDDSGELDAALLSKIWKLWTEIQK